MSKTTVYLPESVKRGLKRLARERRTSEAQLIRLALETLLVSAPAPRPRLPLFSSQEPDLARNMEAALTGFGDN